MPSDPRRTPPSLQFILNRNRHGSPIIVPLEATTDRFSDPIAYLPDQQLSISEFASHIRISRMLLDGGTPLRSASPVATGTSTPATATTAGSSLTRILGIPTVADSSLPVRTLRLVSSKSLSQLVSAMVTAAEAATTRLVATRRGPSVEDD